MDRIERTAIISVLINVGLVILKVALAALSGSLALLADGWHSGSDVVASGLVWAGARISRRDERRHLALIENVVGLIISGFIFLAAYEIFRRVAAVASAPLRNLPVAIGGGLVAALVSYYAAQYKIYVGRQTGSLSLVADGYHSRMDTLTTGAVIVGLAGHAMGLDLDRIVAALVAVFIVASGLEIVASAVSGLREGTAAPAALSRALDSRAARAAAEWSRRVGLVDSGSRVSRALGLGRSKLRLAVWIAAIVVAVWAASGVYFVGPGRVGVVTRWGRSVGETVHPGVHLKAPWPIDSVVRVELDLARRIEVGFRTREEPAAVTETAAEFYATLWESRHAAGTYEKRTAEALRLTGDENIVDLNAVVFYRVDDPRDYLWSVADADSVVRFVSESVIASFCGSLSIDEILTVSREAMEDSLASQVQSLLDEAAAGVVVTSFRLQDMHPPLEVVPAFRDVASAREDKNRTINEAMAYRNQVVPEARGNAERTVLEAEAYRTERVTRAEGDADRLVAMAEAYRGFRQVASTRLYIEAMEELLQKVEKYIIGSDLDLRGYDLRVFEPEIPSGTLEMER